MNKKNWLYAVAAAVGVLALGVAGYSLGKPATVTKADIHSNDGHNWGIIGSFTGNDWQTDYAAFGAYDATTGTRTLVVNIDEGTTFKLRADGAWTVTVTARIWQKLILHISPMQVEPSIMR